MKYHISIFGLSLLWSGASSDSCQTPLGRTSECVSLYDCPDLLLAFKQKPTRNILVSYVRQSKCGFEGHLPRVCCGPLPDQLLQTIPTKPQIKPANQRKRRQTADPVVQEDSYPTARDKCGIDTNGDRIYGGQLTELDEFPWMALLGYKTSTGSKLTYQCGGVLINRRYVLTAAHCVVGDIETAVGKLATARLGEYDLQSERDCADGLCADPVQEYTVRSAHINPGFSDKNRNRRDDIALLRLAKRAKFSYYVQPICLIDNSLRLDIGNNVYVAGWGRTLNGWFLVFSNYIVQNLAHQFLPYLVFQTRSVGKNSPVKLKLSLPIFSKSKCVQKYRTVQAELTDGQLCAGGAFSEDTCRGDSGGPLMRKLPSGVWETVAVVSFGSGCGREGWPGVYTSVASYSNWIKETLRSTNK